MAEQALVQYEQTQHQVASVAELDAVLDQVAADAERDDRPLYVQLVNPDHSHALDVGLGCSEYSSLTFHTLPPAPRGVEFSVGSVNAPEDAEFYLGGTPTVIEPGTAVAVSDARKAARQFVETGRRPTAVAWTTPE